MYWRLAFRSRGSRRRTRSRVRRVPPGELRHRSIEQRLALVGRASDGRCGSDDLRTIGKEVHRRFVQSGESAQRS